MRSFSEVYDVFVVVWQSSIVIILVLVYLHMLYDNRKQDAKYAQAKKKDDQIEQNSNHTE